MFGLFASDFRRQTIFPVGQCEPIEFEDVITDCNGDLALAQDDAVAVHRDGELVAFVDVQQPARFGWDDDPPKIVDLADHTAVHVSIPPRSDDVVRGPCPREAPFQ